MIELRPRRFMLTLSLIVASSLGIRANATLWPFDPQNTPPQLGSIFGDWDVDRLHDGFDIGQPVGTPVKAMEDGFVIGFHVPDPGVPTGIIVIGPTADATEGWSYGHVDFTTATITKGTPIRAGQVIATVAKFSTTFNHLHLTRMAPDLTPLPKNPFQFFSASQLPTQDALMDPANIFFTPDKSGKLAAFPLMANGRTEVSGNVDILAEGHSQVGSLTSPGVYRISYYVRAAAGSNVMAERTEAVFNQFSAAEKTSKFGIVYGPGSTDFQGLYVVTNSGDQTPSAVDGTSNAIENAWFTKARAGVNDGAGGLTSSDMAAANPEAKYPDGSYTVGVRVGTFDGKEKIAERKAVVANWRPHTIKTNVRDSGGKIRQFLEWIFDGIQKKFNKNAPRDVAALGPGTYTVETVFSEPVENVVMSVDTLGPLTVTSSDPPERQQTFTATLVIDDKSGIQDGTRTLTLTAKNLGGDDLLALGPNDTTIDPATQLARDANGAFLGAGGADTELTLKIDRTPPLTSVYDRLGLVSDSAGHGGFTTSGVDLTVKVQDFQANSAELFGSGVSSLRVTDGTTNYFFQDATPYVDQHTYAIPRLDSGVYIATATDQVGNSSQARFRVLGSSPIAAVVVTPPGCNGSTPAPSDPVRVTGVQTSTPLAVAQRVDIAVMAGDKTIVDDPDALKSGYVLANGVQIANFTSPVNVFRYSLLVGGTLQDKTTYTLSVTDKNGATTIGFLYAHTSLPTLSSVHLTPIPGGVPLGDAYSHNLTFKAADTLGVAYVKLLDVSAGMPSPAQVDDLTSWPIAHDTSFPNDDYAANGFPNGDYRLFVKSGTGQFSCGDARATLSDLTGDYACAGFSFTGDPSSIGPAQDPQRPGFFLPASQGRCQLAQPLNAFSNLITAIDLHKGVAVSSGNYQFAGRSNAT